MTDSEEGYDSESEFKGLGPDDHESDEVYQPPELLQQHGIQSPDTK